MQMLIAIATILMISAAGLSVVVTVSPEFHSIAHLLESLV